jgi:uncharacterized protein YcbX
MNRTLTDIVIYPVKSLGSCHPDQCYAGMQGFEHDRKWMLIDGEGRMVTQREIHNLCLFNTSMEDGNITVHYNGSSLKFGEEDLSDESVKTHVWDDSATLILANNRVNQWFSEMLNQNIRMGYLQNELDRMHQSSSMEEPIAVSLADGYPYLVIGTASMNFLNEKSEHPVSVDRFRPNLIIETEVPHEEDEYTEFRLGEAIFKNIKPCARCMVPSIDQSTASITKEPLKTLATYRKFGSKIDFGTLAMCVKPGWISKSDTVEFL